MIVDIEYGSKSESKIKFVKIRNLLILEKVFVTVKWPIFRVKKVVLVVLYDRYTSAVIG